MALQDRFEDLRRRNQAALLAGGVERIARQPAAAESNVMNRYRGNSGAGTISILRA